MTPIIVVGALGRMGQAIIELAVNDDAFNIVAGVARTSSSHQNNQPFPLYGDLITALKNTHTEPPVIIDFSIVERALSHLKSAQDFGCAMLLGTTGHPKEHLEACSVAAKTIPVVVAPNTSLMAVLMNRLARLSASALPNSHKAVLDMHHIHKKDAPSGTAKALACAMGDNVAIESLRLGEILGEHTAYFVNDFERLEITHRVSDRKVFAQGALVASQFLFKQQPGLYDMADVLNLNITIQN
jgi:4-hydroxy-tetrahydrodipicolinate reductase